jgi:hypothetical protein
MRSTLCATSAAECGYLQSKISPEIPRHTPSGRKKVNGGPESHPESNRDHLVDCMEEFVKYTILMRPHMSLFSDRFSEREEKKAIETKMAL